MPASGGPGTWLAIDLPLVAGANARHLRFDTWSWCCPPIRHCQSLASCIHASGPQRSKFGNARSYFSCGADDFSNPLRSEPTLRLFGRCLIIEGDWRRRDLRAGVRVKTLG
ncbi:hypothetical protein BDV96DRAFT_589057 [Lophiotrema nucula]|uniref:Uncharacterized protein n=1 Tax=Lophiotrema nucula TaxID=690887 RepID=A0A6A5YKJ3_9PLEO|nr:hypothetical protein BDV96DRAFT_589057 [Lophiotrema nucula]